MGFEERETETDDVQRAHNVRTLLLMVAELHRRGHERLRISVSTSPSGVNWRCSLAPAALISSRNGALLADDAWSSPLVAHCGGATDAQYFGWTDAAGDTPDELADRFLERYPEITAASQGTDEPYVQWYAEMLRLTDPDHVPIAAAGWELPDGYLDTLSFVEYRAVRVPLPPPIQLHEVGGCE